MWFKNLKVFRLLPSWQPTLDSLEAALAKQAYRPASRLEPQSLGWTPPNPDGGFAYALEGQILLNLRTEKKLLPASVINQVARERAIDIEAQQGYKPGRKQLKELKEQVADELLPQAFSLYRDTRIWMDTRRHWLVLDTAAAARCDEALGLLGKTLEPFPALPLRTQLAPGSAMTGWLVDDAPPAGFAIDQDTELRATTEDRAAVRYVRQSIDIEEARRHVRAGKQCTRLALTWADRISFVLTDGLDIKRVAPLDVLEKSDAAQEADAFDTDLALMTGELSRLLDDLVEALGGELQPA